MFSGGYRKAKPGYNELNKALKKNLQPKDACEKLRMKVLVVFQAFS